MRIIAKHQVDDLFCRCGDSGVDAGEVVDVEGSGVDPVNQCTGTRSCVGSEVGRLLGNVLRCIRERDGGRI